jgi:hypothetical protein
MSILEKKKLSSEKVNARIYNSYLDKFKYYTYQILC